jgi:hypothetical protein
MLLTLLCTSPCPRSRLRPRPSTTLLTSTSKTAFPGLRRKQDPSMGHGRIQPNKRVSILTFSCARGAGTRLKTRLRLRQALPNPRPTPTTTPELSQSTVNQSTLIPRSRAWDSDTQSASNSQEPSQGGRGTFLDYYLLVLQSPSWTWIKETGAAVVFGGGHSTHK